MAAKSTSNKGKRRTWPFQGHLGVTKDHEFILTFINFFFQFCTPNDFGLVFTM